MASTPSGADAFALQRNPAPRTDAERAALLADLSFGTVFTDHMARASWVAGEGWADRRVEPYGPLAVDPAATVFHYAQEVFEGLKAYRHADGSVWLFRPEANAARFAASARRLALPELSEQDFLGSIEAIVAVDEAWVPSGGETSLYLRPFMFGAEPNLGVQGSTTVEYLMIASPVSGYFAGGVKPVSIWVVTDFHRAGPGGTGAAKFGGNYAASMLPQKQAQAHGCQQVMFLDSTTSTLIEELGGMNVFVVMADGSVVTPRLTGTILEGITRSAVLQLLRDGGREVTERDVSLEELRAGVADGAIAEVFACGTAAVVTPVGRLVAEDFELTVGDGGSGAVTMALRDQLLDIQYGRAVDAYGWMRKVL